MNISVDVGYGYTKAVNSEGKKVLFPSLVAPATDFILGDLSQNHRGYLTQIKPANREVQRYFVGELALRESKAASFTMEREKYTHPSHDALLLTAAGLLCTTKGEPLNLAVGLPINCYKEQKDRLCQHLQNIAASVVIDNREPRWIAFNKIIVYPQGAGALLTVSNIPDNGSIALVDVGYKTTDYFFAEMNGGKAYPVSGMSGSVEIGMSYYYEAISNSFFNLTGGTIEPVRLPLLIRDNKICFRGKDIDISDIINTAKENTARLIADRLIAAWTNSIDLIRNIYLAGGGSLVLSQLAGMLPGATVITDSQFANAQGFLAAIPQLVEVASA